VHTKRIGLMKLSGSAIFAGFGFLFITLALTGNSDTAPGFQKEMGSWMRSIAAYVDGVPNLVSLPILLLLVGGLAYAVIRRGSESNEPKEDQGGSSGRAGLRAAHKIEGV